MLRLTLAYLFTEDFPVDNI